MSGFEPIAGSMAAITVLDVSFRAISWIYGKYKLGTQFGDHYQALNIKYKGQVVMFMEIRDLDTQSQADNLLNDTRTSLKADIRDRLLQWVMTFEKCEQLMARHHPEGRQTQIERGTRLNTIETRSSESSDVNDATASGAPTSIQQSEIASSNPSSSSNNLQATHTSRFGSLKKFKNKLNPFHRGQKQSVLPTEQISMVRNAAGDIGDDINRLRQGSDHRQHNSTFAERTIWVTGERDRFMELVKELEEHSQYFVNLNVIRYFKQKREEPESVRSHTLPEKVKNIAEHLRRLVAAIAAMKDSHKMTIQVMLHDDPFQLHLFLVNMLRRSIQFRPLSSMFAMQLSNLPWEHDPSSPDQNVHVPVFFEVPMENTSEAYLPQQALASMRDLQQPAHKARQTAQATSFCHPVGSCQEPGGTANKQMIGLFFDSTPYRPDKTLLQAFNDEMEQRLRDKSNLEIRTRLAFTLASALVYFVLAGCPLDYDSRDLHYFTDTAEGDLPISDNTRAERRVTPYVKLPGVGTSALPQTSIGIMTSAAATVSQSTTMIQRLGVLLYEVGTWTSAASSSNDWKSRYAAALSKQSDMLKDNTVEYFKLVHACLDEAPRDIETAEAQASWLHHSVVLPLKRILGILDPNFRAGTSGPHDRGT